jgi:hypothetical protein
MRLLQWARERNEAMTIWDTGLLKVMATVFGVLAGERIAPHVKRYRGAYVTAALVLGAAMTLRWFTAQKRS